MKVLIIMPDGTHRRKTAPWQGYSILGLPEVPSPLRGGEVLSGGGFFISIHDRMPSIPSPLTGEGQGGGKKGQESPSRHPVASSPPIPTFPRQAGRSIESSGKKGLTKNLPL